MWYLRDWGLFLRRKVIFWYVEIKCQLDATDDFYCRSYCFLNMFRAPLSPSSRAREYYTSGCCLSYLVLGFQVVGMVWSWGLCVRCAGCCSNLQTGLNRLWHSAVGNRPWTSLLDIYHPDPWHAPVAATTVFITPNDGSKKRPKHIEWSCSY